MQRSKIRSDIRFIIKWLGASTKDSKLVKTFELNSQRAAEILSDYQEMLKSPIVARRKYAKRVLVAVKG